jgi:tRNA threonylcarbamoyladenosine biosynthesis protein TsaE
VTVSLVGEAATEQAGAALATVLRAGDLVILTGPLGAGKTTLTRGLGRGLGVRGPVASPTFVIARVHPSLIGGPDLVHVDAYRLTGPADLDDLDLDADAVESVTVVEWGRGRAEQLSADRLEIELQLAGSEGQLRELTVRSVGPRWVGVNVEGLLA